MLRGKLGFPSGHFVRIKARYFDIDKMKYLDPVEFDVPIDNKELEFLKCWLFAYNNTMIESD